LVKKPLGLAVCVRKGELQWQTAESDRLPHAGSAIRWRD